MYPCIDFGGIHSIKVEFKIRLTESKNPWIFAGGMKNKNRAKDKDKDFTTILYSGPQTYAILHKEGKVRLQK